MNWNGLEDQKLRPYPVMAKAFFRHLLNAGDFLPEKKRYIPSDRSRAFLQGYKDYFLRRFGKWGEATEKVVFKKSAANDHG